MEKLLLIAEKLSLMREIENTYKAHKNEIPYEIDFVALVGHIYTLKQPNDYNVWSDLKWEEYTLPLIPDKWETKAINNDVINNLKEMLGNNHYDGIIAAEDADREGNYIHFLVESNLGINKMKTYRLWLNEGLTDGLILKALLNMKDFHTDKAQVNLTKAAILRGRRDWLIGMNFTVGVSLKRNETTHIGTVKSPTLKLIYDNCDAIDNFKEKKNYTVVASHDRFGSILINSLTDKETKKFDTEEEALNLIKELNNNLEVIEYKKEEEKIYAPRLYKLSTLQVDMGKQYGYSPQETLSAVQSLYDTHKLVSYPRTDCEYVTSDMIKDFPKMLNAAYCISEFRETIKSIKFVGIKNPKYINDKKVSESSHTALIPTGLKPSGVSLTEKEFNVLKAIYKRFVAIFLPPMETLKTTVISTANKEYFKANGKVTLNEGFTKFLGRKNNEDIKIPAYKKGDLIKVLKYKPHEIVSKPPQRLTLASLVNAMENAGKNAKDKEVKDTLLESGGLGTPATRGTIIDELKNKGYFITKGKNNAIYITSKGKETVTTTKGLSLQEPDEIAKLEKMVFDVAGGTLSYDEAYKNCIEYVNKTTKEIENADIKRVQKGAAKTDLRCPLCNKSMLKFKSGYGCEGFKEKSCNFFIGQIAGKSLTDDQITRLLKSGHTGLIKGFKSKKGKKFNAKLVLKEGKINFDFT